MNRKWMHRVVLTVLVLSVAGGLWARGGEDMSTKGPISIASKFDTEGALLGNVMRLVLEDAGF
ncbi:MAG: ABC transporter substrate-binding protein, partial [Spirochaetaceae bacterium]|nr:ABC transporter substrate-binding protein [Spirochaetaceae bacterium]